jgi:hypothetical protein
MEVRIDVGYFPKLYQLQLLLCAELCDRMIDSGEPERFRKEVTVAYFKTLPPLFPLCRFHIVYLDPVSLMLSFDLLRHL